MLFQVLDCYWLFIIKNIDLTTLDLAKAFGPALLSFFPRS